MAKKLSLRTLAAVSDDEEFVMKAEEYFEPRYIRPAPMYMSLLHRRIDTIDRKRHDLHEKMNQILEKLK